MEAARALTMSSPVKYSSAPPLDFHGIVRKSDGMIVVVLSVSRRAVQNSSSLTYPPMETLRVFPAYPIIFLLKTVHVFGDGQVIRDYPSPV